jgi:hypothetical protein
MALSPHKALPPRFWRNREYSGSGLGSFVLGESFATGYVSALRMFSHSLRAHPYSDRQGFGTVNSSKGLITATSCLQTIRNIMFNIKEITKSFLVSSGSCFNISDHGYPCQHHL